MEPTITAKRARELADWMDDQGYIINRGCGVQFDIIATALRLLAQYLAPSDDAAVGKAWRILLAHADGFHGPQRDAWRLALRSYRAKCAEFAEAREEVKRLEQIVKKQVRVRTSGLFELIDECNSLRDECNSLRDEAERRSREVGFVELPPDEERL